MSGPAGIALFVVLVALAAYLIGRGLRDSGGGAALFLMLALGGPFLTLNLAVASVPKPWLPIVFGTGPALVAALCAYIGGRRAER